MFEWTWPFVLAGLAAVPLIWWLHKLRHADSEIPVSALFLWPREKTEREGSRSSRRADPRWRLRALLFALLIAGAAGPRAIWKPAREVAVWFDDSMSMQAREGAHTRVELAALRLADAFRDREVKSVLLHSLTHPERTLVLDSGRTGAWSRQISQWVLEPFGPLHLPAPAALDPRVEHWVVTDGADADLAPWLSKTNVHRVIEVGEETENVAVTRLAVRRLVAEQETMSGIARVRNLGLRPAQRKVEIEVGDRTVLEKEVRILPGRDVLIEFKATLSGVSRVRAAISPSDALPLDDQLSLNPAALRPVPVHVQGRCGPSLVKALQAHPGIRLARSEGITVACGTRPSHMVPPALWFPPVESLAAGSAPLAWTPEAGSLQDLQVPSEWVRVCPEEETAGSDTPLLFAGANPVIVASPGEGDERLVEACLDLASPEAGREIEYPVLVAGLLDLAAGRSLLDPVAEAKRDSRESRIAPRAVAAPAGASPAIPSSRWTELSTYLILAAIALLVLDVSVRLRWRRPVATPKKAG